MSRYAVQYTSKQYKSNIIAGWKEDVTQYREEPSPALNITKLFVLLKNNTSNVKTESMATSLPLLKQLHRLPVTYRIHFKQSIVTYYALSTPTWPTWLVSCIFQISLGGTNHQFHNNLLCLK